MKNVKNRFLVLLTLLFTGSSLASATKQPDRIFVKGVCTEITFYSPTTVRILKYPQNKTPLKESLVVLQKPEKVKLTRNKSENSYSIKSKEIDVTVDSNTGEIIFKDSKGNILLKDKNTQFSPRKDLNKDSYQVKQTFNLDTNEPIYGLGQIQNGKLNQRNQKELLRQRNTVICIPFFQSIKGYGVYLDNYSPTRFSDSPEETVFDSDLGTCSDYYFMYGKNTDGVVKAMRQLTGKVPMLPESGFGFWQSRERYVSQKQIVEILKKYRDLQVPIDGIIQDWRYWSNDNKHWNAVAFDNPEFSNPQKMISQIHNMNARLIISIWPSFGPTTDIYKELKSRNMLFDFETFPTNNGVRVYDAFNPEARDIYWEYFNKNMFSIGMDGWWLDATEPEYQDKNETHLDSACYLGSYRNYYNAFPLVSVEGVYKNQRKTSNDKRVFILTRSAFAGQQRTGAISWSGDIDGNWNALKAQIPAGLNFSMTGIPYWNCDIGGFTIRQYPGGNKNQAYQELYTRWTQFAAFLGMMRSHGTSTQREIFLFGERGSWAFDAQEKFINLRYKLLPYIYSTAWDITRNDASLMRPLFADFAEDKHTHDLNTEFLFGKSILVAPVLDPQYTDGKGADVKIDFSRNKSIKVYLPSGCEWYDFWTNEKISGGKSVNKETPIDIMPIYIKAGSILPIGPKVQYAKEKKDTPLEIRIYPGKNATFTLYEDEGDNYNYEKGNYSTIDFKWDDSTSTLSIGQRNGNFNGMLKKRTFKVVLASTESGIGMEENSPQSKTINYNGKAVSVKL